MTFWGKQRQPGGVFTYKGRIGRLRFLGCNILLNVLMEIMMELLAYTGFWVIEFPMMGIALLHAFNYAKRLHDINAPGWLGFVLVLSSAFLTVYYNDDPESGSILELVIMAFGALMVIIPGTKGPNRYGNEYGVTEVAEET